MVMESELYEALEKLHAACPTARDIGTPYWRACDFAKRTLIKYEAMMADADRNLRD
jgi:hypothetical protein